MTNVRYHGGSLPARDTHRYEDRTCLQRYIGALPLRHSEGIRPYFHIVMDMLYNRIIAWIRNMSRMGGYILWIALY